MGRRHVTSLACCLMLVAGCGEPETLELVLVPTAPPEGLIALSAEEFARVANGRFEGRARVVV